MHNVDKRDENSKEDSKTNTRKKIFKCNKNEECFGWVYQQTGHTFKKEPELEDMLIETTKTKT